MVPSPCESPMPRTAPRPLFWAAALLLLALDQGTKAWALSRFVVQDREIIPGWLNLTLAWNTGVAFSLLKGHNGWLLLLVLVLIGAGCVLARKVDWRPAGTNVLFALFAAGALGNLIDRIARGAVVDFIDVHAGAHHWPTFNVADSCITVGAVVLVWQALRPQRPPCRSRKKV
ncbi:MAG TPA: signal peptidase II [Candidatus Methylacidiphilales bacterium]